MSRIIDIQGAAELLAVDYKTVYRLIRSGELPAARIGRIYRLALEDVERYFEERKAATMRELRANGRDNRVARPLHGDDKSVERRCAWCGRELVLKYSVAAECDEPGCEAVICRECARVDKATRCPAHARPKDRNEQVERLRAEGLPVVGAEDLQALAASYLSEVTDRFDQLSGWPADNASLVPREKLAVTIRRNPAAEEWLALDGGAAAFEAEIARRGRVRTGRAFLAVLLVPAVHRSAYKRHGFDVQPCTAADLRAVLDETVRTRKDMGYLVVTVWSPTGWTEQAVDRAATGLRAGIRVVLVDRPGGRCYGAGEPVEYLLNPLSDGPVISECAAFVRNGLAVQSSIRLETLVEEGGFHREIAHRCFERLAATGEYLIDRFDDLGAVISRR